MELFGGVIPVTGTTFLIFCIFAVLLVGYGIGRITIKGISLGDAGVFFIALLFGALFFEPLSNQLVLNGEVEQLKFIDQALGIVEKLGLIFFVTAVGFIAGPKFFSNMKKNFKSYVLLGLIIILAGGLAAVGCVCLGRYVIGYGSSIETAEEFTAMIAGLLSGALTSTPAFSAAKEAVAKEYVSLVAVGQGIAYIFGVLGVVLFVQIMPKITKADMEAERQKLIAVSGGAKEKKPGSFKLDEYGFAPFALAALLGVLVGSIKVPLTSAGLSGTCFSLTTTGGCLMAALVCGHFGKIGKISIMPETSTLKMLRELGLVLFLVGAGVPGGAEFVENFDPMYFVYGAIMTLFPLIVGYLFARYVLKLSLLNNLGALTGGMTSTPALGTLIGTAGTEDVAAAYAATYPIALIAVVLVSQFLIILF